MTTEVERAAEEYAQKYEQSEESRTFIGQQKTFQAAYAGFLKGHAAALRPRKIISGQPDTYPPLNTDVLFYKSKGMRCNIFFIKDEKDLREWFNAGYTTYLPLPPTPQREGEDK